MIPSPYKGLAPFEDTELDALLFFGREREIGIISANVLASRLTVLYGPSGVGKSSLLRAGVAHRLRAHARENVEESGHPEYVVVVYDQWSDDPVAALRQAVRDALAEQFGSALLEEVEGEPLADTFGRWTEAFACDLLLVLDQAEEYFLYHAEETGFARELPELVTRPDCACVSCSRSATMPWPSWIASRAAFRICSRTTSGSTTSTALRRGKRS